MSYYPYYRSKGSGWGTSSYKFAEPPAPKYQPQPSWSGRDYYHAHSSNADNTLFDYVWSKMKGLAGRGYKRDEAKHWHRRAYGGLGRIEDMLPSEIGAAAGYEAMRMWKYHKSVYRQPLSDDQERELEALVGLATGEAEKLWAYTNRPTDRYGRMEASEVAAATAERIFEDKYEDVYEDMEKRRRRRGSSVSSSHSHSGRLSPNLGGSYGSHHHHGHRRASSASQYPPGTTFIPASPSLSHHSHHSSGSPIYQPSSPGRSHHTPLVTTSTVYPPGTTIIPSSSHRHHHHRDYSQYPPGTTVIKGGTAYTVTSNGQLAIPATSGTHYAYQQGQTFVPGTSAPSGYQVVYPQQGAYPQQGVTYAHAQPQYQSPLLVPSDGHHRQRRHSHSYYTTQPRY